MSPLDQATSDGQKAHSKQSKCLKIHQKTEEINILGYCRKVIAKHVIECH